MLQDYEFHYLTDDLKRVPKAYKFDAMITTYEMIITDIDVLSAIPWRVLIIDEAHRLKNRNCKLLNGLQQFNMVGVY